MSEERTEDRAAMPPPGAADADQSGATVEALRREAEEHWNKYLRTAAELDNLRKRCARDVEAARKFGAERLAQAILPVRDSVEAGLAAADKADAATIVEGQRATLRLLDEALAGAGIREIHPLGEPFDPTKHEALSVSACRECTAEHRARGHPKGLRDQRSVAARRKGHRRAGRQLRTSLNSDASPHFGETDFSSGLLSVFGAE